MVSIDLINQSDTLWLETPKGVLFIPLQDGYNVFLWPNDDRSAWAVGATNTRQHTRDGTLPGGFCYFEGSAPMFVASGDPQPERTPAYFPMATAMRKAEEWIVDHKHKLPSKFAPWRKKNKAPTDLQADYARRLGIAGYDGMTSGRLSDEISIALMGDLIDTLVTDEEEASQ
jgi:hypothetical protein